MQKSVSESTGIPGVEDQLLAAEADTEAWHGRFKRAREFSKQATDSALRYEEKETAAAYQALVALREVEVGQKARALSDVRDALKLADNRNVSAVAALVAGRAGDTVLAQKLAAQLSERYPLDTLVQRYWLPTIRASGALAGNAPSVAIDLLDVTRPLERSEPAGVTIYLCPEYVRGEAYLMMRNGSGAQAEFQKFIDHYGLVGNFPLGALSRLGLARAYSLQGSIDKAKAAYEEFLKTWRDADSDIPIYKQAKSEYLSLGRM